jgi:hypothetical protein
MWWIGSCTLQLVSPNITPNQQLDPMTLRLVCVLLLLSSVICLTGSILRDVMLGFAFEFIGWLGITLALSVMSWGLAEIAAHGWWASLIFSAVFIVGGVWRMIQIARAIKRLRYLISHDLATIDELDIP